MIVCQQVIKKISENEKIRNAILTLQIIIGADILSATKSLEMKAEPIDFSGFKTPSPSESLHLDKIFSTGSLKSGFSSFILTAPTIMDLDIAGIKSDWESKKVDPDGKLD